MAYIVRGTKHVAKKVAEISYRSRIAKARKQLSTVHERIGHKQGRKNVGELMTHS